MTSTIKFVILSGFGWLLDLAVFSGLVILLHAPEGFANFSSATIAAMTVFLVSQPLVYNIKKPAMLDVLIYWLYTETNIVVWSIVVSILTPFLASSGIVPPLDAPHATAAVSAKVMVTPFSMGLNILVSRWLSRATKSEER